MGEGNEKKFGGAIRLEGVITPLPPPPLTSMEELHFLKDLSNVSVKLHLPLLVAKLLYLLCPPVSQSFREAMGEMGFTQLL